MCLSAFATCSAVADPFPPEINLANLDPANGGDATVGVLLEAMSTRDQRGTSVAGAGDIDGDGRDDVLVGAPESGTCDRCAAYLVFGRTQLPPRVDLFQDAMDSNGADAFFVRSIASRDHGGQSVSRIGDLNADGLDDFVVGAPEADPDGAEDAGESYVVFGRRTGFPASFDVALLLPQNGGDGSEGFILRGATSADETGISVSGGCDVNADGLDDLLIGAEDSSDNRSYLLFGRTSGYPPLIDLAALLVGDGSAGFAIEGIDTSDTAGYAVACVRDANADAIDDLLIGAPMASPHAHAGAGESYLLFGHVSPFPAIVHLANLLPGHGGDGSAGSVLTGVSAHDNSGLSVADAGDVNHDGLHDLLIGAPYADPHGISSGRTYLVFGRARGFPAELSLAELLPANGGDGSEGIVLNGSAASDVAGYAVAGAGDVDDDDISDFIIGAPFANTPAADAGFTYVVFGRSGGFPAEFELSQLLAAHGGDGTAGFVLRGAQAKDNAGTSVGGAGDVNGDGAADILVGAPQLAAPDRAGRAYVVFGRPADEDGDGVPAPLDNCSELANEDQRDTDGDGFGNVCDADLNDDCIVNFVDLGALKRVFFTGDPDADFDGNGAVSFGDLEIMRAGFFQPPGPSGVADCPD